MPRENHLDREGCSSSSQTGARPGKGLFSLPYPRHNATVSSEGLLCRHHPLPSDIGAVPLHPIPSIQMSPVVPSCPQLMISDPLSFLPVGHVHLSGSAPSPRVAGSKAASLSLVSLMRSGIGCCPGLLGAVAFSPSPLQETCSDGKGQT